MAQLSPSRSDIQTQTKTPDARVWLKQKVAVELDSRRHHSGGDAFEQDRKRDTKLQMAGFRIVRITDRRLKREGEELEADLRDLLVL
jgi:very-short-patch-repair endonuclease